MDTYYNQLKKEVIDSLVEYSSSSDLANVYPEFLSIYTLICISKGDYLDDYDKSLLDSLLNRECNDIDLKLNEFFDYIESRYNELHGVFNKIEIASPSQAYTRERSGLIHMTLERLNSLEMSFDSSYGKVFNALLDFISKNSGKKAGEFYTPNTVVDLMVKIISPEENKTIYDPVCGSAGLLIKATEYIKSKNGDLTNTSLFGQEINSSTWQIAKQNLLVNDLFNSCIYLGNTLLNPANLGPDGQIIKYDYVLANPPFSLKNWDKGHCFTEDSRFIYGNPPKNNADYAFVQHCLASLKETGKAAIILSSSSLSRMGSEGKIRQRLIEDNVVEAIIGLPSNLFHGTTIAPNIIILNNNKNSEDITFIDASENFKAQDYGNTLDENHKSLILSLYNERKDSKGLCAVISRKQVLEKEGGVLSVSSYIKKDHFHKVEESLSELQAKQNSLTNRLNQLENEMLKLLKS